MSDEIVKEWKWLYSKVTYTQKSNESYLVIEVHWWPFALIAVFLLLALVL